MPARLSKPVLALVLFVAGIFLLYTRKPSEQYCEYSEYSEYSEYLSNINQQLKLKQLARPVVILDLDRIDFNVAEIKTKLDLPLNYRSVTRSLPSIELLKYVMQASGSNRLMAFHAPYRLLTQPKIVAKPVSVSRCGINSAGNW